MALNQFVRRSYLLTSVLDRPGVQTLWTHNADAVILDLADTVPNGEKLAARELIRGSIQAASAGAAEVFVRINRSLAHADLHASVWPGLTGIVYPGAEAALEIDELDLLLSDLEKRRGLVQRSVQIMLLLSSGTGVWKVREIIKSSSRITALALDEINLCNSLGIGPNPDFDPFVYARGRIIIEGRAAKIQPVGISHPYGMIQLSKDSDEIHRIALRSKNMGFAGVVCPAPAWAEPCNRAFTPTNEQVEMYRETRRLFAEAVARGTAAVPYPGTARMIDVPVDERARVMLELWERCVVRDAEKAAAVNQDQSSKSDESVP